MSRRARRLVRLGVLAAAIAVVAAACNPPVKGPPQWRSATFFCTGGTQSWVVPPGVSAAIFQAWGAQGGSGVAAAGGTGGTGGLGGFAQATLVVNPGELIYLNVGCPGGNASGVAPGAGGFGGGNEGGGAILAGSGSGGGGGASDVRRDGNLLGNRVLSAGGGGGGAGAGVVVAGEDGGNGGHPQGTAGGGLVPISGLPGTQTAGGQLLGTLGIGGPGAGGTLLLAGGGGGGGGFYGGGGGAAGGGGGGGSSLGPAGATFMNGVQAAPGVIVVTFYL